MKYITKASEDSYGKLKDNSICPLKTNCVIIRKVNNLNSLIKVLDS